MAKPQYRRLSDGSMIQLHDGLQNVVANLGTHRDKVASSTYTRFAARWNCLLPIARHGCPEKLLAEQMLDLAAMKESVSKGW